MVQVGGIFSKFWAIGCSFFRGGNRMRMRKEEKEKKMGKSENKEEIRSKKE